MSLNRSGRSVDVSLDSARSDKVVYVWNSYSRSLRNCSWLFVATLMAMSAAFFIESWTRTCDCLALAQALCTTAQGCWWNSSGIAGGVCGVRLGATHSFCVGNERGLLLTLETYGLYDVLVYACYALLVLCTLLVAVVGDVVAFWPEKSIAAVMPADDVSHIDAGEDGERAADVSLTDMMARQSP